MTRELRGRVVDEHGRGIARLRLSARYARSILPDAPAGDATTDPNGSYRITLELDDSPITLRISDQAAIRTLYDDGPFDVASETTRDVILPRERAQSWVPTLANGAPAKLFAHNAVAYALDGERVFREVLGALRRARRTIHLAQFLFKPDFALAFEADDPDKPILLVNELANAAKRGVQVRVLLNENAIMPDDVDKVRSALETLLRDEGDAPTHAATTTNAPFATVRGFPLSPEVMHAKLLVVDDEEAHVMGQPFEPRWWDTNRHLVDDPRRGRGQPMHDAGMIIRGPFVAAAAATFAELWNALGDVDKLGEPITPEAAGNTTLHAARTMPTGVFTPAGETAIIQSYERALANAERFAFIETQYFTSERVARAIRLALDHAPKLQVIMVINDHMDIPLKHYDRLQAKRLEEIGWPNEPRIGAFSLATIQQADNDKPTARNIYTHTKVSIIDDAWATLGSANLDGYALDSAAEFGLEKVRSVEWNAVILDGIENAPQSGAAKALRLALWSEELGVEPKDLDDEPTEGWLGLWTRKAEANLSALSQQSKPPHGLVFPYNAPFPDVVRVVDGNFNPSNRR